MKLNWPTALLVVVPASCPVARLRSCTDALISVWPLVFVAAPVSDAVACACAEAATSGASATPHAKVSSAATTLVASVRDFMESSSLLRTGAGAIRDRHAVRPAAELMIQDRRITLCVIGVDADPHVAPEVVADAAAVGERRIDP